MAYRRWKARTKFLGLVLALALLGAGAALGISLFLKGFYSHSLTGYEPRDIPRQEHLERTHGPNR